MKRALTTLLCIASLLLSTPLLAQEGFLFGADLSYVNEMEDCGVVYMENGQPKDPYQIFADHNCGIVRLRLWHTPSWYDTLNAGQRYSDFADVVRSSRRAKEAGMQVLLDFHLSDLWADPSRQIAPAAWHGVVDDLPTLQDSLYHYVYGTLMALQAEGLLPEMVQVGNETNRGILLSPEVNNAGWSLDWPRNAALFNTGIQAVRDAERDADAEIKIALHVAGPSNAAWFFQQFEAYGVTNYDIIGLSYYWAWHKPTSIAQTGQIIANLRTAHPGKEVMVFETGYIWTLDYNDNAANIINDPHPDYLPVSPETQRQWLIDFTQAVIDNGGTSVMYWEPAWVSSTCFTPWGQGSHQEHATFFDFNNNLLPNGGIGWMEYDYAFPTALAEEKALTPMLSAYPIGGREFLMVRLEGFGGSDSLYLQLFDSGGGGMLSQALRPSGSPSEEHRLKLPQLSPGIYFLAAVRQGRIVGRTAVWLY
jgi:arabinogalactan endo-1,4-beta-galactosidase